VVVRDKNCVLQTGNNRDCNLDLYFQNHLITNIEVEKYSKKDQEMQEGTDSSQSATNENEPLPSPGSEPASMIRFQKFLSNFSKRHSLYVQLNDPHDSNMYQRFYPTPSKKLLEVKVLFFRKQFVHGKMRVIIRTNQGQTIHSHM
jgi:hypothetical protein